jgi:hypothetical protein
MKPISIQAKKGKQVILHKCQKCGVEKTNKVSETDDFEKILELMKRNFNS